MTNNQKSFWCRGLYKEDLTSEVLTNGNTNRTSIAANKAKTPRSLLGIDLKIA